MVAVPQSPDPRSHRSRAPSEEPRVARADGTGSHSSTSLSNKSFSHDPNRSDGVSKSDSELDSTPNSGLTHAAVRKVIGQAVSAPRFEEWWRLSQTVKGAYGHSTICYIASLVSSWRPWSEVKRRRAIGLLAFAEGPAARETAKEVLAGIIKASANDKDPQKGFFSRRRFASASAALDAALQLGGDEGFVALSAAFGGNNRELALCASYSIQGLVCGPGQTVRLLVSSAQQKSASERYRRDVIKTCGFLGDELATPFLLEMLAHEGDGLWAMRLRREAAHAIATLGAQLDSRVVEQVGELLLHRHKGVRSAAATALSLLGHGARSALISVSTALDEHFSTQFSLRLLRIVTSIKQPEARALLLSIHQDPSAPAVVRSAAERFIGES